MSASTLIYELPVEIWENIFDYLCKYPLVPHAQGVDALEDLALFTRGPLAHLSLLSTHSLPSTKPIDDHQLHRGNRRPHMEDMRRMVALGGRTSRILRG